MALVCRSQPALVDSVERASVREALSTLLAPEYVNLAFSLPPTSSTIWNFVDEDIERMGSSQPFPSSIDELLGFLAMFFSKDLVEQVAQNLSLLESSFLGSGYALRRGQVVLARTMVDDILRVHVIPSGGKVHDFLGEVEGGSEPGSNMSSGGRGLGSGGGRRGRAAAARGGGRRGNYLPPRSEYDPAGAPFRRMLKVVVPLPAWRTPPKGVEARRETLAARSFQFKCHGVLSEDSKALYDPRVASRRVNLFHGTRSSSLHAFNRRGIHPPARKNEFCAGAAFYVTNSVQHAVEHPLHNHPGQPLHADPPAVLVFSVDVVVLHGEKPSPAGDTFLVHWFEDDDRDRKSYEQWLHFCIGNLRGELKEEDFDVVIGPVCLRSSTGATKLKADLGEGVKLTQIALCSKRAREWLASCVTKAYCEQRQPS